MSQGVPSMVVIRPPTEAELRPLTMERLASSLGITSSPSMAPIERTSDGNIVLLSPTNPMEASLVAVPMSPAANMVTKAANRTVGNFRIVKDIARQRPMLAMLVGGTVIVAIVAAILAIRRSRRSCTKMSDCKSAMFGRNVCYKRKCETRTAVLKDAGKNLFDTLTLMTEAATEPSSEPMMDGMHSAMDLANALGLPTTEHATVPTTAMNMTEATATTATPMTGLPTDVDLAADLPNAWRTVFAPTVTY